MVYEITIPDMSKQHLKNAKTRTVQKRIVDPISKLPTLVNIEEPLIVSGTKGVVEHEMGGSPVWGLGCPNNCGRFWEFTADMSDLVDIVDSDGVTRRRLRGRTTAHVRPMDKAAYQGVDKNGNPTQGYLNFRPDPAALGDVRIFNCDRCGAEVRLKR